MNTPSPIITPSNSSPLATALTNGNSKPTNDGYVYPIIAVVGPSGSGKTTSIEKLPKESTLIINIERKPLPFPQSSAFQQCRSNTIAEIDRDINVALNNKDVKYLVIDSFTKYCELLMQQCRKMFKGYDIFTNYNDAIFLFLERLKNNTHCYIILTAIDEMVPIEQPNGARVSQRRIAVEGKKWEGKIEKEFTCVLYTDVRKESNTMNYQFLTNSDGVSNAKSPRGLFPSLFIPNNLKLVCDSYAKFDGIVG